MKTRFLKVAPIELCEQLMKNNEHGLKLIKEKIGPGNFVLPKEAVDDPEDYFAELKK